MQNVFDIFSISMKHSYLLTAKTTPDFDNSHRFINGTRDPLQATISMLDATFCAWLWHQLSWCSIYKSHSFASKIYKKYQSSLF